MRLLSRGRRTTVTILVVLLASVLVLSPWGRAANNYLFDTLLYLRGGIEPHKDILLVAIDEASFGELKKQWPWPRELHAKLINSVFAAGASAVGIDILFPEPSSTKDDTALAEAVAAHPNLVLAKHYSIVERAAFIEEVLVGPWKELVADDTLTGSIDLPTDEDGFVRAHPKGAPDLPPFATTIANAHKPDCCGTKPGRLIHYAGPPGTFEAISYYQALDPQKYLPKDYLKGKVLLVGLVTQAAANPTERQPDHFPVPMTRWGYGFSPGVEIHANIVSNLLRNTNYRQMPPVLSGLTGLLLAAIFGWLFLRVNVMKGALIAAFTTTGMAGLAGYLFVDVNYFVPLFSILLPFVATYLVSPFFHYFTQLRQRQFIRGVFANYLSPAVISKIEDDPTSLELGGEPTVATIMFLDIAGFTTLSEQYTKNPKKLVEIMNRFLGMITEVVLKHEGMVDKFIGDAVMAVWNVPVAQDDHAIRACRAALEIQTKLAALAADEKGDSGNEISARIGINTGLVVAGNVGGADRFDYTVLGNPVNLAARLEGANKFYGSEIMIGEDTQEQLERQFELRHLDTVRVKGKNEPVDIYELQAEAGHLNDAQGKCNEAYARGFAAYSRQDWDTAIAHFQAASDSRGGDAPSETLQARCVRFKETPPEDWDGVYDFDSK